MVVFFPLLVITIVVELHTIFCGKLHNLCVGADSNCKPLVA